MKKIKVIHSITRLVLGGAQQTAMEICEGLNRDRFEVSIISGAETGPEGELISEVRKRGISLTIMPEIVRAPDPVKDLLAVVKMTAFFKKEKPHIVHTHSSKTGILGRWAAKAANVPIIIHTVHGWGHHVYKNRLYKNLFTFLERRTAKISDKLIVVSSTNSIDGLRDGIGESGQYTTIHSCINLDEFTNVSSDPAETRKKLGINPDSRLVGTVGRLSPQKNPLDFIRTAEKVKKELPDTQFIYVGDGPLRNETEKLVKETGLSEDVFLPGLRTDVPDLLCCMDVFILTSLWEGLPRVIPQAMACRLPVVANAVDGVCEIIDDKRNGFLILPGDISLMSERVISLLKNEQLKQKISQKGMETARKDFSLTDMVQKLEDLYEEFAFKKGLK